MGGQPLIQQISKVNGTKAEIRTVVEKAYIENYVGEAF